MVEKLCKNCKWYEPGPTEPEFQICKSPKVYYGYGRGTQGHNLKVEDDEGWGMIPSPYFGCIHFSGTLSLMIR